jgi:hypothetical protein
MFSSIGGFALGAKWAGSMTLYVEYLGTIGEVCQRRRRNK